MGEIDTGNQPAVDSVVVGLVRIVKMEEFVDT